jgi:hypothetical protein
MLPKGLLTFFTIFSSIMVVNRKSVKKAEFKLL